MDAGDQQIGPAVVVVVSGGDAHPVAFPFESGLLRDVFKFPAAQIVVKAVPPFGA